MEDIEYINLIIDNEETLYEISRRGRVRNKITKHELSHQDGSKRERGCSDFVILTIKGKKKTMTVKKLICVCDIET